MQFVEINELSKKKQKVCVEAFENYANFPECDAVYVVTLKDIYESAILDATRNGNWIKHWCDNNMIGHEYEECSECGCTILDTNQFWDAKYCPNCGAKNN